MKRLNNKGITLIALVITIIVLLILAGVTIATLTGENGILTRASEAEVETRGAAVEEEKNLWEANKIANKYATGDVETLAELLERIGPNGSKLLTQEEVDEINETGKTTIGSRTIEFGTDAITIGEIYEDSMIGQKVTYSSNRQSDWIIFGKDQSGNILLTTEKPIDDGFNLYGSAEKWLTYEEDLDNACSGYGGTIQGKPVTSRSITIDDINNVSGFDVDSLESKTYYTFGTETDTNNGKINAWFPSLDSANYWKKATVESETTTFEGDSYYYLQNSEKLLYGYIGNLNLDATNMIKNPDKLKYIWGETEEYTYLVNSKTVSLKALNGAWSDGIGFYVSTVYRKSVAISGQELCLAYSFADMPPYYYEFGNIGSNAIRPIVVLPSDIEVEENASGQWDIAY